LIIKRTCYKNNIIVGRNALKHRIIIVLFFVLLIGIGLFVYWGQKQQHTTELYYSGTIEATTAELSFQVNGKVTTVRVDEGEAVKKGQILAELDGSEYDVRLEQARANVDIARMELAKSRTVLDILEETIPAEISRAEAGVKVLESQLKELTAGYRQQDIEQARLAFLSSRDVLEEARKEKLRYESLFRKGIVSEQKWDTVKLNHETALKEFQRAKEAFNKLEEGTRKETIQTARDRVEEGKAILRQAKSNLKQIDAAKKDCKKAESAVNAAQATSDLARIHVTYTLLRSPFDGIITSRSVEPGEVLTPGREIFTLSDLSIVELKIFVDEPTLGRVKPGQPVTVSIDTFPDKTYQGTVSFISPEGEFTPKIIQTHKERVKLVYRVKIRIPNPTFELKSGMPADAWLR